MNTFRLHLKPKCLWVVLISFHFVLFVLLAGPREDNPIVCNWYNVSIHSDPALYADAISECERRDATLLTQQSYGALKQSQCSKVGLTCWSRNRKPDN